ncbi:MAG TPA: PQQ-binding-like beta-propeller repeat protein, partial [Thermomicrobiales bacterium]|nr:PQQ-binding-like beta-propeller repeat protein [Thermomicrobiales bacterium]
MSSSDITRDAALAMENVASSRVNRRKLVGYGAGVAAGAALIASSGAGVLAQEPNATPAATPTTERRVMGSTRTPESLGDAVPPEFGASTNWPAENRDFSNTRHAVDSGISSETIGQLGDAWRLPIDVAGTYGALTAVPIVVDNTVYLQDMQSNVTALNKETGEVIWRNEYSVPTIGPNGIAAGYGFLAFSLGDTGEMVAVKAEDGSEVWRTSIQGPLDEGITMAPLIYDSTVYVSSVPINSGVGSYLGGQRGVIYALDLNNGNVVWYFD